jgi:four helix bundle protein
MNPVKPRVRGYRDLIAWQRAIALVVECYAIARMLPGHERYELARQLRRAVTSIPANIAEGSGRRRKPDYARFLAMARGSLSEVETYLEICAALGYADAERLRRPRSLADEVGRMLTALLHRQLR